MRTLGKLPNLRQVILLPAMLLAQVGQAEEVKAFGQINEHLRISGDMRIRYENWGYFDPSTATAHENSYDFVGHRIRLGALLTSEYVDGFVQGEYTGLYGLPENATVSPVGALGMGANYYNDSARASSIADGLEYKTGNAKFDAPKAKAPHPMNQDELNRFADRGHIARMRVQRFTPVSGKDGSVKLFRPKPA
ncbi:hypothetical protein ACH50O_20105 [Methylomonas sp. 2BW1-5-20]|uniref:hypothetical protein n=1 Tax=Methylomonas sp. 2BW1-5-20 TaxID=3376686 RepID=UPI0040512630